MSWRGEPARYGAIAAGCTGGGGEMPSRFAPGLVRPIAAWSAGGGGRVASSAEPLQGLGGCGGPGPGAMIGLGR